MIKNEIIKQDTLIKHVYCDECGTELKRGMQCSVAKCEICGKDLCDDCIGHEADSGGDYREVYCKSCWEIGEPYRNEIHQLENKIESLYDEWHNDCEKKVNNKKNVMNKILIAEVQKKPKFVDNAKFGYRRTFVSFDRDRLKNELEKHYNIKLVKNDIYDFPYFTDGGFKYTGENEDWFFETTAYLYDII